jgi:RNA polymerase sigma-70 factor (ECF subfamily)
MQTEQLTSQGLSEAIGRVAQGDRRAFEAVYRETSSKLMGICLRVLHDRGEAENVLHEVYMTVWLRAGSFSSERGTPMGWLATIARNRAIDRVRAGRPETTSVALDEVEIADDSPSAFDGLLLADEHARLHDCLDSLREPHRSAIRMAFFEGVTYEVLARRKGVPLGTMKSWVRRGLSQLKNELELGEMSNPKAATPKPAPVSTGYVA